jgi:hypothetical protein
VSFNPSARRLQQFYGFLYGAVAVFMLGLPLFEQIDELGKWFVVLAVAAFGLRSAWHFRRAFKLAADEPAFPDVSKMPISERAATVKRAMLVGTPAVAVLSAWAAWDLRQLELGRADYVTLWAPLSLAYDLGGYWAAVLGLPVLWVFFIAYAMLKLRREQSAAQG